ncbi:prepilin-type N-terminal cleavage/methylation domain-containing protein [Candidatus Parcubacteria bacterium]|nr:prepilin-type N-terminal cleavage/methylation domain-containing protein [Candidatus Parcubacteria bacterium]
MNIKQKGFTIVELLVVLAIFGILSGLVVVTLKSMKDEARLKKAMEFAHTVRVSLGSDLVGEWTFDDSSDLGRDTSGYENHATVHGTTPVDGIVRGALSFNGTSDHIDCGNNESLCSNDNSWTIEAWFNWGGKSGENIIYNKENLYEARVNNGYFQYAWQPHWHWDGGTDFSVDSNKWHHAVVVYDKSSQYVYKDGELVYTRPQEGNIGNNTNKLLIGARGHTSPRNYFDGAIDEVRIYNRALTTAEIQKYYAEGAAKYGICLLEKK